MWCIYVCHRGSIDNHSNEHLSFTLYFSLCVFLLWIAPKEWEISLRRCCCYLFCLSLSSLYMHVSFQFVFILSVYVSLSLILFPYYLTNSPPPRLWLASTFFFLFDYLNPCNCPTLPLIMNLLYDGWVWHTCMWRGKEVELRLRERWNNNAN